MSDFMEEPALLLPDKAGTLEALENPDWMKLPGMGKWRVKSQWLCDELNEFERTQGTAYNLAFQRFIERREGIGPFDENGSPLALLVYNAQQYRRSDALRAQGFEPGTEALLEQAFAEGRKLELFHDSILGGSSVHSLKVRRIAGTLYAMLPNKRTRAVNTIGKPVRLETGAALTGNAQRTGSLIVKTL